MLSRLSFLPEIVFLLVGAYLVYLPVRAGGGARVRPVVVDGGNGTAGEDARRLSTVLPVQLRPPLPGSGETGAATVVLRVQRSAAGVGYTLDRGPVLDLDTLAGRLQVLAAMRPRPRIRLEADGEGVSWGELVPAMRLCNARGLTVEYANEHTPRSR